jgi:hypothetical protein
LENLLHFLAPIAFGLGCKPVLAVYNYAAIRSLAMALARWQLSYSLLAIVDNFLILEQSMIPPHPSSKADKPQAMLQIGIAPPVCLSSYWLSKVFK